MIQLPRRLLVLLSLAALMWGTALLSAAPADEKKPDDSGDPPSAGARLRLGTGRFRHGGTVTRIYALPDGKRLLTIAQDMKARVWDMATAKELVQFRLAPNDRFTNLVFSVSSDGKTLAAANFLEHTIRIYTLADGKESVVFAGLPVAQGLLDLEYSSDGKMLVSLHRDRTYRIWDVATAKELRTLGQPVAAIAGLPIRSRVRFLPDGKALAVIEDWTVRLVDVENGKELRWFGGHTAQVQELKFSPDGKHMATVAYDRVARLWDLATGKTITKFSLGTAGSDLAFSADGKTLAFSCSDRSLRLFDVASGKQVSQINLGVGFYGQSFAMTPDGKAIYVSSAEAILHGYDTATGKELYPVTGHAGGVNALVWSPDGKTIATSGSGDTTILLWDAASGKMLHHLSASEMAPITRLQFTADGKSLLSSGNDRTLRVWDVAEGTERSSFVPTPVQPGAFAFSHDGKLAAVQGTDHMIRVWDISSEKELHRLEVKTTVPRGQYNFSSLQFAGDNRTLLAHFPNERTLRHWDAVTGRDLGETKGLTLPYGALLSPAGDSWSAVVSQGATTTLIEMATGKPRQTLTLPPRAPVPGAPPQFISTTGAALSPDGRTAATLSSDGTLRFWDTGSAKVLTERKDVPGVSRLLAFAPDGKTLATAGIYCEILLWDVPGPKAEGRLVVKEVTADTVAMLWNDVSGEDPGRAWQAILNLVSAPKETVPFVQKQLKPTAAPDDKQIAQWIKALDADGFQEREDATEALVRTGRSVEDAVRKALVEAPSAEAKQRMQSILEKLSGNRGPNMEEVRATRGVEVLERVGTPEAQKVLEEVAKGTDGPAAAAARAALERIKTRGTTP